MKTKLNRVTLSFPDVFVAKAFGDSDPKFSATFLIEKGSENDLIIQEAIKQCIAEKFGAKAEAESKKIIGNSQRCCYSDGDDKIDYAGFAGHMSLRASSKFAPTVVDSNRTPLSQQDGKIYSGATVTAIVNFFCYDNKFGKGVSCGLQGIQFVEHGEPLGGGTKASIDDFDDLSDGLTADDFM